MRERAGRADARTNLSSELHHTAIVANRRQGRHPRWHALRRLRSILAAPIRAPCNVRTPRPGGRRTGYAAAPATAATCQEADVQRAIHHGCAVLCGTRGVARRTMTEPWHNWSGSVVAAPARIAAPRSEDELAAIVRGA